MTHLVTITVGDYSNNGHGYTRQQSFTCNFTASQIAKFHADGSTKHKLYLDYQCEEHEDNELRNDFMAALNLAFANEPKVLALISHSDEKPNHIYANEYIQLYLHIAKLAEPTLTWTQNDGKHELNIGGYGLFFD